MTDTAEAQYSSGEVAEKGLKSGALGLVASVVIGVASTAPAYSLAATLGFIVAGIGLQSPVIVILAFVPMLFTAIGYSELNKADPDCGTTFTWATRAFGPKTGWIGGWGIIAADVLVMASLAQVAGQYRFLLFNADGIGGNPVDSRVLLVGVLWIVLMTWICYRGIELSARLQEVLLSIELIMLLVFAVVALVKVGTGNATDGSIHVSLELVQPVRHRLVLDFFRGLLLDDLHLLGLGQRSRRQRGDRESHPHARPRRCHLDRPAARHLHAGDIGRPVLRRYRRGGHRSRQRRQLRGCHLRARQGGVRWQRARHLPLPSPHPHGADVGRCVDADDDPADGAHHPVDGRL